ncbi:sensor domain-containing protein [Micromonospora sp. NPDC048909]|uniref:sensor domain-containing protein n=1 Tax=Micromonospora sp. NPDC048909 TaxID=3155643 RepID=UPI0033D4B0BC
MGTTMTTGVGGAATGHRWPGPPGVGGEQEPVSIAGQAVRDLGHLLAGGPVALAGGLLALGALVGAALSPAGIGLPLLDGAVTRSRALMDRQRRRVAGEPVASPYRPATGPATARLSALVTDPATYRDLLFQLVYLPLTAVGVLLPVVCWLGAAQGLAAPVLHGIRPGLIDPYAGLPVDSPALAAVVGLLVACVAYRLPRGLVELDARLTRALLGPTARHSRAAFDPPAGGPTVVQVELPCRS